MKKCFLKEIRILKHFVIRKSKLIGKSQKNVLQTPSSQIISRKKFFKEKGRKTSRARTLTKNQFLGNALGLDSHQKELQL